MVRLLFTLFVAFIMVIIVLFAAKWANEFTSKIEEKKNPRESFESDIEAVANKLKKK